MRTPKRTQFSGISTEITRDSSRLDYDASVTEAADRMRFQQEIGLTACKSVILVNGGATISILTFIGNHPAVHDHAGIKKAVISFAIGIGAALISLILGYFGQNWLAEYRISVASLYQQDMIGAPRTPLSRKEATIGRWLMVVASTLIMWGIGMFIYGAITATNAIL